MHHNFSFRAIREKLGTQALLTLWDVGPLGSPSKVDINTQASYRQCPTGRLFQYWVESGRVYIETNRGLRSGWVVLCSCDWIFLGILLLVMPQHTFSTKGVPK